MTVWWAQADLVNLSYLPAATLFDHEPIQCRKPTRQLGSWGRLGRNAANYSVPGLSSSLELRILKDLMMSASSAMIGRRATSSAEALLRVHSDAEQVSPSRNISLLAKLCQESTSIG